MLRKSNKLVSFSPDNTQKPAVMKQNHGGSGQNSRRTRRSSTNFCSFKNPIFSPLKLLRRMGEGASRTIHSLFRKRAAAKPPAVTPRPSSSQGESHHKEAIQDCIEFINSSSFSRSNSVSEKASANKDGRTTPERKQEEQSCHVSTTSLQLSNKST